MSFRDVVGHARAVSVLQRAIAHGRQHHAYLFHGPRGVGKRRVAKAYCAALFCQSPVRSPDTIDACGACPSCHKVQTEQHADWMVIQPDGRFTKIAQVREVIQRTRYRPHEAPYRVVVFDDAHTLKEEAANALLKTLEEPGGETLFVLVTDRPSQLLATIRSRSQPLRFGRLADDEVLEVLERLPDAPRLPAASIAEGSVARALEIGQVPAFAHRSGLLEGLLDAMERRAPAALGFADTFREGYGELSEVLEVATALYRDALTLAASGRPGLVVHRDVIALTERLAAARGSSRLLRDLEALLVARRRREGNVNPKLLVDELLLSLCEG